MRVQGVELLTPSTHAQTRARLKARVRMVESTDKKHDEDLPSTNGHTQKTPSPQMRLSRLVHQATVDAGALLRHRFLRDRRRNEAGWEGAMR